MKNYDKLYDLSYSKLNALECEYGFWKTYVDANVENSITTTTSNIIGTTVHEALTNLVVDPITHKMIIDKSGYDDDVVEYIDNVINSAYNNNINSIITKYKDLIAISDIDVKLHVKPDLVCIRNNDILIVEFKTFTMKFTAYGQLYLYLLGIIESDNEEYANVRDAILEKRNVKLIYHYLSEDKVEYLDINMNDENIAQIRNQVIHTLVDASYSIDKIIRADKEGDASSLRVNKKTAFCRYCCVRGVCPASKEISNFINDIDNIDYTSLSNKDKILLLNKLIDESKDYIRRIDNFIEHCNNEISHIITNISDDELRGMSDVVKIYRLSKSVIDRNRARELIKEHVIENRDDDDILFRLVDSVSISKGLLKDLGISETTCSVTITQDKLKIK